MLLKATGVECPTKGVVARPPTPPIAPSSAGGSPKARGSNLASPRVARLALSPANPVVERIGGRQSMRVVATYADGTTRDVTGLAFLRDGQRRRGGHRTRRGGRQPAPRRSPAPGPRFEGSYAATTLTVMGDRDGFVWHDSPAHNRIDELVAAKWKRIEVAASALLRRRHLHPPRGRRPHRASATADEVREFLANPRDTRSKRDALIERLLGSPAYVEHWAIDGYNPNV